MQIALDCEMPAAPAQAFEKLDIPDRAIPEQEVDKLLEKMPRFLMDGLIDNIRSYRHWRSRPSKKTNPVDLYGHQRIEPEKKSLFVNLAWVFDLYETPALADFNWVCQEHDADPEHLRAMLSRAFSQEIREIALAVHKLYPSAGYRIQSRLRGCVDIDLTLY